MMKAVNTVQSPSGSDPAYKKILNYTDWQNSEGLFMTYCNAQSNSPNKHPDI